MSQRIVFSDINKILNVLQIGRSYRHGIQGQPSGGEWVKMTYSIKHSLKFYETPIYPACYRPPFLWKLDVFNIFNTDFARNKTFA